MSYEMIDRFLRNNLCDDDYAEYSEALEAVYKEAKHEALLERADYYDSIPGYEAFGGTIADELREKAKELE